MTKTWTTRLSEMNYGRSGSQNRFSECLPPAPWWICLGLRIFWMMKYKRKNFWKLLVNILLLKIIDKKTIAKIKLFFLCFLFYLLLTLCFHYWNGKYRIRGDESYFVNDLYVTDLEPTAFLEEFQEVPTLATVGNGLELRCGISPSSENSHIIWSRHRTDLETISFPGIAVCHTHTNKHQLCSFHFMEFLF